MVRQAFLLVPVAIACGSILSASPPSGRAADAAGAPQPQAASPTICKMVVSPKAGSKPFEMCLTKAEWEAKRIADARDANRLVCKYTEDPKTRFRSFKVCMTAAEWENQRLADRQAVERIQMQTCVPGAGC